MRNLNRTLNVAASSGRRRQGSLQKTSNLGENCTAQGPIYHRNHATIRWTSSNCRSSGSSPMPPWPTEMLMSIENIETGSSDDTVNDQIEASIQDELKGMRQRPVPQGEGLTHCAECEEEIPEARRRAMPGCVDCQSARDSRRVVRGGINRRGSKDSQLR